MDIISAALESPQFQEKISAPGLQCIFSKTAGSFPAPDDVRYRHSNQVQEAAVHKITQEQLEHAQ